MVTFSFLKQINILNKGLLVLLLSSLNVLNAQTKKTPLSAIATIGIFDRASIGSIWGYGGGKDDKGYMGLLEKTGALEIGSGFVYNHNNKKYLITAAHVVQHALTSGKGIKAFDYLGNAYEMDVVGGDTFYDIAVLIFHNPASETNLKP